MEFPFRCRSCGREAMVDLEHLQTRTVDAIVSVEGYNCPFCENWEPVFYITVSLKEKIEALQRLKPSHRNYHHKFHAVMEKAKNLQAKMRQRNGSRSNSNLAPPGSMV